MPLRRLLALLLILAAPAFARAEDMWVLGDSIGEGVHLASGLPSQATHIGNVAIYTPRVLEQIARIPRGSLVFISLGTNDAVASQTSVNDRVEKIVAAAEAHGLKQIWIGPPCVTPRWQVHSKEIDESLKAKLAELSVPYVSAQEQALCPASIHAGDGVHFTMAGYRLIWQKAATVAGVPVVVASSATPKAGSTHIHAKSSRHWRKKNSHREKDPADAN